MRFTNTNISGSADVKTGMKFLIAQDSNGDAQIYKDGSITSSMISASNMALNVMEKVYKGSLKVTKYDSDGKTPLAGVTFKLVGDDGKTYTKKTDNNGQITFSDLIPQHYVLTETSTLDGYDLMKDNVDVDIPMKMSEADVAKYKADKSKVVWDEQAQAYCFYNQTVTVTNTPKFELPVTGGTNSGLYAGLVAAVAMMSAGVVFMFRKKKLG